LAEGQTPLYSFPGKVPETTRRQWKSNSAKTFERIKVILEQAGGSMRNLVILRAYFVHFSRESSRSIAKCEKEYLIQPYPASTAVGVTELAPFRQSD